MLIALSCGDREACFFSIKNKVSENNLTGKAVKTTGSLISLVIVVSCAVCAEINNQEVDIINVNKIMIFFIIFQFNYADKNKNFFRITISYSHFIFQALTIFVIAATNV